MTDNIALTLFDRYATRDAAAPQSGSAFPQPLSLQLQGAGAGGSGGSGIGYETFVISINENSPRWKAARYRLEKAGMASSDIRRWPAVDGKAMSTDSDAMKIVHPRVLFSLQNNPVCLHDIETWGTIGCYMSHWALWQYVVRNNLSAALVFEDDVIPRFDIVGTEFPEVIDSLIREAGGPSKFDFMRFEWVDFKGAIRARTSPNLYRSRGLVVNLGAYVVTNRGARRMIQRALPISDPIDMLLTYTERTQDDFVSLLSRRILTVQDRKNFESQIATNEERRERKESFCRIESDVLADERMPAAGNPSLQRQQQQSTETLMWWAIGALAVALVAAIIIIVVVLSRRKTSEAKKEAVEGQEKIQEGEKDRE